MSRVLADLRRGLDELGLEQDVDVGPIVRSACARADALRQVDASARDDEGAAILWLGDVLAGIVLVRRWKKPELNALFAALKERCGRSERSLRLQVYREALRSAHLLDAPPLASIEAQLTLLTLLAPVLEISVWWAPEGGAPLCVVFCGEGTPSRRVRTAARETLVPSGWRTPSARAFVRTAPVISSGMPCAALVYRAAPANAASAAAFVGEAALAIAPALERSLLMERSDVRERVLVESSERRLTRLALDIHDGPLQDVVALAHDLRYFGRQLAGVLGPDEPSGLLLGRLEDFDARLMGMNDELRELAESLQRSSAVHESLLPLLERQLAIFEAQTGIAAQIVVQGNPQPATASQQLALVSVIREALANVRDHSAASSVTVFVSGEPLWLHASIVDDGRGFEVERTIGDAVRRGRIGLLGMRERIRLLGGRLEVNSRPGGPTAVSAALPLWQPLRGAEEAASPRTPRQGARAAGRGTAGPAVLSGASAA
jgi:signal transduction histidine kinase